MRQLVIHKIAWIVPTLVFVTLLVFLLIEFVPGDPARRLAGPEATPDVIEQYREQLRLDDPVLIRYGRWLGDAVRGDLQESLVTHEPVWDLIIRALPATVSIALLAALFSMVFSAVAASLAALRPRGVVDRLVSVGSSLGMSMPTFWVGLVLISLFAINRDWFPALGYVPITESPSQWLHHLILPALALSGLTTAELSRQLRGALGDELRKEYITTAYAKRLSRTRVVGKHALKNAANPVITILGVRVANLLGGVVVIEKIFAVQGLGTIMIDAVLSGDIPVVLGVILLTTSIVLLLNLLVDLSYAYFNPRLRTAS